MMHTTNMYATIYTYQVKDQYLHHSTLVKPKLTKVLDIFGLIAQVLYRDYGIRHSGNHSAYHY